MLAVKMTRSTIQIIKTIISDLYDKADFYSSIKSSINLIISKSQIGYKQDNGYLNGSVF